MKILFLAVFLTTTLLQLATAYADTIQDRKNFLKAETALNKGKLKTWQSLQAKLKDYPLYADLLFKQAIRQIDKTSVTQAEKSLADLTNTPLRKTYLKSWLRRLVSRRQWDNYLKYYETGLGTRYQCHYADALYRTGQADKAFPEAKKLWLISKSQVKQCDPVFKHMKKAGQLSDTLIWERIELAIQKGQTSLVKFLRKSLPKNEQILVTEWLQVRSKPARALNRKYINSERPRHQKMLVYGLKRMALFEADKALKEWNGIRDKVQLNDEDKREIERYIALRMTTQRLDGAVAQHQLIPQPDSEILEWGVRAALKEGNWSSVDNFIKQMGDVGSLADRWKYWKAKTADVNNDSLTANTLYQILASGRGYHNFLAADAVAAPYQFNHKPLQYKAHDIQSLQDNYNVKRAHELYAMGRIHEARREWYYLIKQFGDKDRQKLAFIQKQWGWHSQAILTIARADYYDDLSLRFPIAYEKEVRKASQRNALDTAWIMALMRQESAFQPDARSSAGARGLMQLMPKTSRHVARLLKQRRPKLRDLYKPAVNIKLGTHYLKTNLSRFNDNKLLTTAAYNAGPHRVSKWLPNTGRMEADAWAETIPFKETRNYVQRIMSYAAIYDHKLGLTITRLKQRMKAVDGNP